MASERLGSIAGLGRRVRGSHVARVEETVGEFAGIRWGVVVLAGDWRGKKRQIWSDAMRCVEDSTSIRIRKKKMYEDRLD